MTQNEINMKIETLRMLEAMISKFEGERDRIKDELKAELDSAVEESIETNSYRIFYKPFERTVADTAKLKEDGLFANYSKKSVGLMFKITDRKESK